MEELPEIHGHHEHELEESAHNGDRLSQRIAIFTALLATIGAIVSFMGGHTISTALFEKNNAVLKQTQAANQWAYYQAKAQKQNLAVFASDIETDSAKKEFYKKEAERYAKERDAIKVVAERYEKEFAEADKSADEELGPHEKYGISMTLLQIAIALASVTALTRRRWLLYFAAIAALFGSGIGGVAYFF